MDVALSILLAAAVGGVVFMLLERWHRAPVAAAAEPAARVPIWTPEQPVRPAPATSLFSSALSAPPPTIILPGEEHTEPLPRPSVAPPPYSRPAGLWDDPPHRDESDEDEPPRGLWSGWAR